MPQRKKECEDVEQLMNKGRNGEGGVHREHMMNLMGSIYYERVWRMSHVGYVQRNKSLKCDMEPIGLNKLKNIKSPRSVNALFSSCLSNT